MNASLSFFQGASPEETTIGTHIRPSLPPQTCGSFILWFTKTKVTLQQGDIIKCLENLPA